MSNNQDNFQLYRFTTSEKNHKVLGTTFLTHTVYVCLRQIISTVVLGNGNQLNAERVHFMQYSTIKNIQHI